MVTAWRAFSPGFLRASSSARATFSLPLACAMHTSFALADSDAHFALADLYSAAMLLRSALYSSFDIICAAIAPALNTRANADAKATLLKLFMWIPCEGGGIAV